MSFHTAEVVNSQILKSFLSCFKEFALYPEGQKILEDYKEGNDMFN